MARSGNSRDSSRRRRRSRQRGASLIEFVLIGPLLFAVLFGIIEFGWAFYQVLDTRHGAREAARLIAVNYSPNDNTGNPQRDDLIAVICTRLENPDDSRVQFNFDTAGEEDAGDLVTVRVERDLEQLTNFYNLFLDNVKPNSEVTFRLERNASWSPATTPTDCP